MECNPQLPQCQPSDVGGRAFCSEPAAAAGSGATREAGRPAQDRLRAHCAAQHRNCFACRPVAEGGLGLSFALQADGSVSAEWLCPAGGQSYPGIVHGGLLATALDSAMVHCLFARDIVARTGELNVRYRRSVRSGAPVLVTARLRESFAPLHYLEAEIRQDGSVCAQARAKFMAVALAATPSSPTDR